MKTLSLIITSLFAGQQVLAQDDVPAGALAPAVEISAFRLPTLLRDTTQAVELVGGAQIEARRPATLIDLIRQVPGVHVDQLGSAGGIGNVYIRGSDPENVLVLIDGVRANDSTLSRGGAYDLTSMDPAEVERIEIVKGPASSIYGADAMGGLINVITKTPKGEGLRADLAGGVGGAGYRQAGVTGGASSEHLQVTLGASMLKDGEREDGGDLDVRSYRGRVSFTPFSALSVRVFGRHNERQGSNFPDLSGGNRLSVIRTLEERDSSENVLGIDGSYAATDHVSIRALATTYKRAEDLNSPGVSPLNEVGASLTRTDYERDTGLLSAQLNLPARTDVIVGYEQQQEEGTRTGTLSLDLGFPLVLGSAFELDRVTRSWFVEAKSRPVDALVLQAGLRKDSITRFGAETNPSLGARYDIDSSGTTLKANYAEGFRPPSFSALGDPNFGNPNLRPESSKSMELGVEQSLIADRLRIGLAVFSTETENLVTFDFATNKLVNRTNVDTQGFEFEVSGRPVAGLEAALNYTYVDVDVLNSAESLAHRPSNRAGLRIEYAPMEALGVVWTTAYVGPTSDSSIPTGAVKLGGYFRSDFALRYRWQRYTATFNVDNVFDKGYEQYVGFVNPGIRFRAGVSASF